MQYYTKRKTKHASQSIGNVTVLSPVDIIDTCLTAGTDTAWSVERWK